MNVIDGMWPSGKATDFDSVMRRFESCHPSHVIIISLLKDDLEFGHLFLVRSTEKMEIIEKNLICSKNFHIITTIKPIIKLKMHLFIYHTVL